MAGRKGVSNRWVFWATLSMLPLASTFLPAASAQSPAPAEYADVEFTPVITDANDYPGAGFLDFLEIAIGMTWDETLEASLVFRFTVEDRANQGPFDEGILRVFFELAGTRWQGAVTPAGTPYSTGSLGSATRFVFDRCDAVEDVVFCMVSYEAFQFVPPATMTSSYAYSYGGTPAGYSPAQDRAPGGLATDAVLGYVMPLEWGADYHVTNVTRPISAAEAPGESETPSDDAARDLAAAPVEESAPGPPGILLAVAASVALSPAARRMVRRPTPRS